MGRSPRNIGTAAESAVVRTLCAHGFPNAERRALHGSTDLGDITGIPGVVIEVKAGNAARIASDGQVERWLAETERERRSAKADIGVLVLQRAGVGAANAHRWWAVVNTHVVGAMHCGGRCGALPPRAVRLHLGDLLHILAAAGYGTSTEGGGQ